MTKDKIKLAAQKRRHYLKYKEKIRKYYQDRIKNLSEEDKEKRREYYKKYNKKYQKGYRKEYEKNRLKTDIQFKLAHALRSRMNSAIKQKCKSGSAVNDLGCSIENLILFIEKKFKVGMSWENHGEWHIDHIKPLTKFDLSDRKQFLEACNYTNLQPLWAKENISKGNR